MTLKKNKNPLNSYGIVKEIASLQNSFIKNCLLLQEKSKKRKESGLFVIEGLRELNLAQKAKYQIVHLLICEEICGPFDFSSLNHTTEVIKITKEVYQKLAYRESTEGIIALANVKSHMLSDLKLSKNPLILVLESIEKPGNIGAILRTADAAGIDAVIIADPITDLYNPNIIRSSVGCLFTNEIAIANSADAIKFLQDNHITMYAATLQNANPYHLEDYTKSTALIVGTEATGITKIWREASNKNIIIPMQGEIDSMNVSVAAALLLFEAKRQRNFSK